MVVPATAEHPSLQQVLDAVEAGADPPDEVIVVSEPPGAWPSTARNLGVARASGDVVVFVDADVVVHADAIQRIRAAFAADPGLTAVFGSYDDAPSAPGAVSGFRNLLHHQVHQGAAGTAQTFWSALGAVRRDAFLDAGGFDERRRYLEDIELGMRLVAAGGEIKLDPTLLGTHTKGWSLREMIWTDFAHRGLPWMELIVASRRVPGVLNLGWRHRLSAALSVFGLVAIVRRRPGWLAGAAAGLVALNGPLYALVARRRGLRAGLAAPPTHALHHTAGIAAVIGGLVRALAGSAGGAKPVPVDEPAAGSGER